MHHAHRLLQIRILYQVYHRGRGLQQHLRGFCYSIECSVLRVLLASMVYDHYQTKSKYCINTFPDTDKLPNPLATLKATTLSSTIWREEVGVGVMEKPCAFFCLTKPQGSF